MEVQSEARLAAGQPQDTGERRAVDERSCCADGLKETLCINCGTEHSQEGSPINGNTSQGTPGALRPWSLSMFNALLRGF